MTALCAVSVMVRQHEQYQDAETEAAKWTLHDIHFISQLLLLQIVFLLK